jgi:hypothetical protein
MTSKIAFQWFLVKIYKVAIYGQNAPFFLANFFLFTKLDDVNEENS